MDLKSNPCTSSANQDSSKNKLESKKSQTVCLTNYTKDSFLFYRKVHLHLWIISPAILHHF